MGYIGREPTNSGEFLLIDNISGDFDGSETSFTLKVGTSKIMPAAANTVIALDGVLQEPSSSYTISGSTITFTAAPDSTVTFYGVLAGQSQYITNYSITDDHISLTADISGSKINTNFGAQGFQLTSITASANISGSATSTGSFGRLELSASLSASATSTGSFGAVYVGGMTNSNLVDVSSSVSSRTTTLEGTGTTQGVGQSDAVTFSTVNTGQGANELYDMDQNVKTDSNVQFADIISTGTITAQQIQTEFVSASITLATGSNIFGDNISDSHQFTGSIKQSGSFTTRGNVTGSATSTGSFGRVLIGEMGNTDLTVVSSSVSTRATTLENANISGGFVAQTVLSGSGTIFSGSVLSTGSFGSVVAGGTGTNTFAGLVTITKDDPGAGTSMFTVNNVTGDIFRVESIADADDSVRLDSGGAITLASGGTDMLAINNKKISGSAHTTGSFGKVAIGHAAPSDFLLHAQRSAVAEGNPAWESNSAYNIALFETDAAEGYVYILSPNDAQAGFVMADSDHRSRGAVLYNHSNGKLTLRAEAGNQVTISGSGQVGIGTTAPEDILHVYGDTSDEIVQIENDTGAGKGLKILAGSPTNTSGMIAEFGANNSGTILPRLQITPTGKISGSIFSTGSFGSVGIGQGHAKNPSGSLYIHHASRPTLTIADAGGGSPTGVINFDHSGLIGTRARIEAPDDGDYRKHIDFLTHNTNADAGNLVLRLRINSSGVVCIGTTDTEVLDNSGAGNSGINLNSSDGDGRVKIAGDQTYPLGLNRLADDGVILNLRQDATTEGSISISGATVSYNAFLGSHWSELSGSTFPTGSIPQEIKRGTVVSTIDEITSGHGERLAKFKVSDTENDIRVYGVFGWWDYDDDNKVSGSRQIKHAAINALGAGIARITGSCNGGDLLVSAGNGCAKVNNSATLQTCIGKVTANTSGSATDDRLIPVVLYCG